MNKKIFIASTSKNVSFANTISAELSPEYNTKVWTVDTFHSGDFVLESILSEVQDCHFAIILLTADDKLIIDPPNKVGELKEDTVHVPRDNLVFEAGIFLSAFGKDRVALCAQNDPKIQLPSDMNGINKIEFPEYKKLGQQQLSILAKGLVSDIKKQFENAKFDNAQSHIFRIPDRPLGYGDARHTDVIVDSAFQPTDRKGMNQEIKLAITSKRVIPTKFFYATEEGASAWLGLTGDAGYHFFNSSIDFLDQQKQEIARLIASEVKNTTPDFVSLGSGDGRKDAILLPALVEAMGSQSIDGKLAYYPLDFSFYLITETIKNVSSVLTPDKYKIKPIVGDIAELASFRYVYENTPNVNIFSILGNTIGNNDEREVISSISSSMFDGDYALIEVNTSIPDAASFKKSDIVSSDRNLRHGFSPLGLVGYDFDPSNFDFDLKTQQSGSPGAVSILTKYKVANNQYINISLNHRYEFVRFCAWIGDQLNCEVVEKWQNEPKSVGLVLLRRCNKTS